jgi:hypothetical protein
MRATSSPNPPRRKLAANASRVCDEKEMIMKHGFWLAALLMLAPVQGAVHAVAAETAIAPEVSPPGDIPDNQAFIVFKSPAGFSIKVPEGWARTDGPAATVFNDKYNHISLAAGDVAAALDVAYAKSTLAPEIEKSGHAVKILKVSEVTLKAGKAIKISFDSNSEPNAVTNKQVREENEAFFYARDGKMVTLRLSAPKGADNVDQWKLISSSFRWR